MFVHGIRGGVVLAGLLAAALAWAAPSGLPMIRPPAGASGASSGKPHVYGFQLALRTGKFRVALTDIRKELESNPDDADLHAYAGIAAAHAGIYGDAATEFDLALGSDVYERTGISSHADTLRMIGQPKEAAELRQSQLAIQGDPDNDTQLWLGIVDDLRYAGDYDGAYEAAWQAAAISPGSGLVYAVMADMELDMGNEDEAAYDLWTADRLGGNSVRAHVVRARLSMMDGDLDIAYSQLAIKKLSRKNHILGAMQAEILRRQGYPDAGLSILLGPRYPDRERPDILAEMMACYAQMGDMENAISLRRRGLSLFPDDPNIAAAVSVVDKAEAAAAHK